MIDLDELERLCKDATFCRGLSAEDRAFTFCAYEALPTLIAELRAYRLLEQATTVTAQWPTDKYFGITFTHYRGDGLLVERLKSLLSLHDELKV